ALAHVDPTREALAREVADRYPPLADELGGVAGVLRSGRALIHPEVDAEPVARVARDAEHCTLLRTLHLNSYLCAPLVAHGQTLLCDDLQAEPRALHREVIEPLGLRAWVGVPLNVAGRTIGVLVALACRPAAFTTRDVRRLESLAALAGAALQESQLLEAA